MKKIAIVTDGWRRFANYAWISGSRQYIKEHHLDVDIYVFNSFGNFSRDEKFNSGEYNIINLPDFREFDGIILEVTNISPEDIRNEIIDNVKKSKVPAVSLLEEIPGLYHTGINNYSAMEKIVEHLVTKHGCKTLNYVGGPVWNSENKERLSAYCDVLKRHGIEVEEQSIIHKDYEIDTGEWGFEYFLDRGLLPEAFVCANDNIAVGLCHHAAELGYRIPDDFLVTGFDNFDKACIYEPRITTVGFTKENIAYKAMGLLDQIWSGSKSTERLFYVDVQWVFQDSCGCKAEHPTSRGQYVIDRIFGEVRKTDFMNEMLDLKRHLLECNSYLELAEWLPPYFRGLHCEEMFFYMNRDFLQVEEMDILEEEMAEAYVKKGYPEEMDLVLACGHGKLYCNMERKKGDLIPQLWKETSGNMYLFAPIHFRDREVGYLVLQNCDYILNQQLLFEIMATIQEALENLYGRLVLKRMNKKLSLLYIMDSLTGLYNRMAYNRLAIPLYERCMKENRTMLVMFVDADHLKYINDHFGHDMGNLAISSIASVLRQHCPVESISIRYGGDEFVCVIPDYNKQKIQELAHTLLDSLEVFSANSRMGFPIEASIGWVIADDPGLTLNDYINLADEKMYSVKKSRKAERKDF